MFTLNSKYVGNEWLIHDLSCLPPAIVEMSCLSHVFFFFLRYLSIYLLGTPTHRSAPAALLTATLWFVMGYAS